MYDEDEDLDVVSILVEVYTEIETQRSTRILLQCHTFKTQLSENNQNFPENTITFVKCLKFFYHNADILLPMFISRSLNFHQSTVWKS